MHRRDFLRVTAGAPLLLATIPGEGSPYGALLEADEHGLMLPEGFRAREIARAGAVVHGSSYEWHLLPDGGATFEMDDGGWVYVSNSEVGDGGGGVGAIRFDRAGTIVDAYSICSGTTRNCAGGATPWVTWLTCEEFEDGRVWECDPRGERPPVVRPAMGVFAHEAVAADPVGRALYMTEDADGGRLYRFTPASWGDLATGALEVAREAADGTVTWHAAEQDGTEYSGGEGIAYFDGRIVFTTKSDQRVRELDLAASRVRVVHGPGDEPRVVGPDNVVFSSAGDLIVCEDTDEEQDLVLIAPDGSAAQLARLAGHEGSELAGAAFDPSGTRLYVSSQRGGDGGGTTYEISGPFRQLAAGTTSTTAGSADRGAARRAGDTGDTGGGDAGAWVGAGVAGGVAVLGGLAWWRRRVGTRGG